MNTHEAKELIQDAIPRSGGAWADLGAGAGTFTRALLEVVGPSARIYAVDRDSRAIATLARWAATKAPNVTPMIADFTRPFDLPDPDQALDGMLFANALHFVRDPEVVLARLAGWLRPGGRVVFVEYEHRSANRWVPYPIPPERLPTVTASAGLSTPVFTARRPSAFGGNLYVATADTLPGGRGLPSRRTAAAAWL